MSAIAQRVIPIIPILCGTSLSSGSNVARERPTAVARLPLAGCVRGTVTDLASATIAERGSPSLLGAGDGLAHWSSRPWWSRWLSLGDRRSLRLSAPSEPSAGQREGPLRGECAGQRRERCRRGGVGHHRLGHPFGALRLSQLDATSRHRSMCPSTACASIAANSSGANAVWFSGSRLSLSCATLLAPIRAEVISRSRSVHEIAI